MPHPLHLPQPPPHPHLPYRLTKRHRSMIRHDFVVRPVDQKGRRRVSAATEMRQGGYSSYEVGWRLGGPGPAVRGTDTVKEEGEAVAFFEEGEDEFWAGVAGT